MNPKLSGHDPDILTLDDSTKLKLVAEPRFELGSRAYETLVRPLHYPAKLKIGSGGRN